MKRFMIVLLAVLMLSGCTSKTEPLTTGDSSGTMPPLTEPDRLPDEVENLKNVLEDAGLMSEVKKEDVGNYSFDGFEHTPVEYYVFTLINSENVYLRLYDSAEAAADEASNYGEDGSEYGYDGVGMIIDYAFPIHFWLSESAIIEHGSFDYKVARILKDAYGEQFAGFDIPDSDVIAFTYSSVEASAGETELSDAAPINTREELEEYYQALKDSYYWSLYNEPQLSEFEAQMENYPEEWFEDNSLIIVYAYSGSSPAYFYVMGITREDDEYKIVLSGDIGNDTAIVEKYIFIELENRKIEANSRIVLVNAYPRPSDPETDNREKLTLERLVEMVNSGEELTWSDFEDYRSEEVGSGLYIMRLFLKDRGYMLLVGGAGLPEPDESPDYIRLYYILSDREEICEIGKDDLTEFLNKTGYVAG